MPARASRAGRVSPLLLPNSSDTLDRIPEVNLKRENGIAYREGLPSAETGRDPALLIHGFPQSSFMWAPVVVALAGSGRRAIAPDLVGYGDSPPDPPGTWERQVEALERFRQDLGLERVVLGGRTTPGQPHQGSLRHSDPGFRRAHVRRSG